MGCCTGKIAPNDSKLETESKPHVEKEPTSEERKQIPDSLTESTNENDSDTQSSSDLQQLENSSKEAHIRNLSAMREDEDNVVYHNDTDVGPLQAFRGLFVRGSVWTGMCEWHGDKTSLALEFTIADPPNEEGILSVSRLYHVKSGKQRTVNDIQILEQQTLVREIIFKYHEDTPEGMELFLMSNGREDGQEINIRRAYVRGMARKRKVGDEDEAFVQGTFDFVRTYCPSSVNQPAKLWLKFESSQTPAPPGSMSPGRIAERIEKYSEQFDKEIKTGRSTSIPKPRQ